MPAKSSIPLPVVPTPQAPRRRWTRWRVYSLVAVHVVMVVHGLQWLATGRTLSPVEPSESMVTLETGAINAGFIFLIASLAATLVFGRFVCGWGCHFIAYQDLCTWLLTKARIKPRPLGSRALKWVPYGLAAYMFFWPTAYRWWRTWCGTLPAGYEWHWSWEVMTGDFWDTFPGPVFAVLSVVVAGFGIVYFLGSKGFCTYACPYGALYGVADRLAPLRVRVSEACDHVGACSSVCTSNVDVADQVARFGAVVDPMCMKCGDCVTSCPNEALRFGWGTPALLARRRSDAPAQRLTTGIPWTAEAFLVLAFGFYLFAWRGLYGGFPLLMSAGMAGIFAYATLVGVRLLCSHDVAVQWLRLKAGGRRTRSGLFAVIAVGVLVGFSLHAFYVQYHLACGERHFRKTAIGDAVWRADFDPQRDISPAARTARDAAARHYAVAAKWSLIDTPRVRTRLAWVALLNGDMDAADRHTRRAAELAPTESAMHLNRARVLRLRGEHEEAVAALREGLRLDSHHPAVEAELGLTLLAAGRLTEARTHYQRQCDEDPENALAHYHLGALLLEAGETEPALRHLTRAVECSPTLADAHAQLGMALTAMRRLPEAEQSLRLAVRLDPDLALAHYNLGVVRFMQADPKAARSHVREALRLDPADAQAKQFLDYLNTAE